MLDNAAAGGRRRRRPRRERRRARRAPTSPSRPSRRRCRRAQARDAVARDVGVDHPATVTDGPTGPRRETDLQHRRPRRARPVRRRRRRPARLAGDLQGRCRGAWYDAVVDAATGGDPAPARTWSTRSSTRACSTTTPARRSAGRSAPCRSTRTSRDLRPATTLSGPYRARLERHRRRDRRPVGRRRPTPAGRSAPAPRSRASTAPTAGACDAAHKCSWNGGGPGSWTTNREQNAVQASGTSTTSTTTSPRAPIGFDARPAPWGRGRPLDVETDDGARLDGGRLPDGDAPQQREHDHAARRPAPRDADVPFDNSSGRPSSRSATSTAATTRRSSTTSTPTACRTA